MGVEDRIKPPSPQLADKLSSTIANEMADYSAETRFFYLLVLAKKYYKTKDFGHDWVDYELAADRVSIDNNHE